MANYLTNTEDLKIVADSIREKGGTTEQLIFPNGFAKAVNNIQTSGGNNPLEYATFASANNQIPSIFSSAVFPDGYSLELNMPNLPADKEVNLNRLCYFSSGVKSVTLNIPSESTISLQSGFEKCQSVETINLPDRIKLAKSGLHRAFNSASSLVSIFGRMDVSNSDNDALWHLFFYTTQLRDISFMPNTIKTKITFERCVSLSNESVESIIDGLADLTGSTAQEVHFPTAVVRRMSEAQKQRITNKNWTFTEGK